MRFTRSGLLAAIIGVTLMADTSVSLQDISRTLDEIAASARQSRQLPGLSVAVRLGQRVLLAKGYGEADVENHVPTTADTIYQIGSITRAFTAASVFRLVSEGKVSLDDRVASRLPKISLKAQSVTLRHLLTHTSGIPNYSDMIGPRERAVDLTPQETVSNEVLDEGCDYLLFPRRVISGCIVASADLLPLRPGFSASSRIRASRR